MQDGRRELTAWQVFLSNAPLQRMPQELCWPLHQEAEGRSSQRAVLSRRKTMRSAAKPDAYPG